MKKPRVVLMRFGEIVMLAFVEFEDNAKFMSFNFLLNFVNKKVLQNAT